MLVENIKQELQSLQQWSLSFVRREGNKATHILSRLGTRSFMGTLWHALNEPPACITRYSADGWSKLFHLFLS
jgi:hypothetical protein